MCILCRPHVEVHKERGVLLMWTGGEGGKKPDFLKWMAPKLDEIGQPRKRMVDG